MGQGQQDGAAQKAGHDQIDGGQIGEHHGVNGRGADDGQRPRQRAASSKNCMASFCRRREISPAQLVSQGQKDQGDGEDAGPDIEAHPKIRGHNPEARTSRESVHCPGQEDQGFILPGAARRHPLRGRNAFLFGNSLLFRHFSKGASVDFSES